MPRVSEIRLHSFQVKAWESKKRFIAFCSGVQGGKTTFGSVWVLNEAQERGPGEYIILSPTYKILKQSTLTKFFEIMPQGYGTYNKADSTFETIDGRMFFLRSAEKPESIEGITAKAIWADEASLMKPNAWLIMQGRVSATRGRILLTFTPVALNWIYHELYKRWKDGDPDYEFIQFRNVDNPYFPKEEYERAKRTLTETQFKLRYEGVFTKAEGLIYPDFGPQHIIDDFQPPDDWLKIGGIDFGYNNPFVALKGALSPDDVLIIYDEHYKERELLQDHAKRLDQEITYFADPSGKREIEELLAMGFDIQSADNDVNIGINKVNERIKTSRLKVCRRCRNLIDEFETYRWEEEKDRPVKLNDHACDSLRYLVMGLEEMRAGIGDELIVLP